MEIRPGEMEADRVVEALAVHVSARRCPPRRCRRRPKAWRLRRGLSGWGFPQVGPKTLAFRGFLRSGRGRSGPPGRRPSVRGGRRCVAAVGAWRPLGNWLATHIQLPSQAPSKVPWKVRLGGVSRFAPMRLMSDSVLHFSDSRFPALQEIVWAETGRGWRSSSVRWKTIA